MNRTDLLRMFFVGSGIKPAGRNPHATKRGPGRRRTTARRHDNHDDARKAGIPKALRQYAKRYGGLDVFRITQIHQQHKEPQA